MAVPPITKEDLERAAQSAEDTRTRRRMHLQKVGGDEIVHQIEDVIQHLDHSKTMRETVGDKHADFMVDRARQLLIELLGIHLEDCS
jgi:asparagine synthetase B (glutamine-hydrolysing)